MASLDRLSEGRLVLGIGVGRREDDYTQSGLNFHERGRQLDTLLERATAVWDERPASIGPEPFHGGRPQLMFGGDSPAAFLRMARYGAGWIAGGGFGDVFRAGAEQARQAWTQAGRDGRPRLLALAYFALGPDGAEHARSYLEDYYAFTGPFAQRSPPGR